MFFTPRPFPSARRRRLILARKGQDRCREEIARSLLDIDAVKANLGRCVDALERGAAELERRLGIWNEWTTKFDEMICRVEEVRNYSPFLPLPGRSLPDMKR